MFRIAAIQMRSTSDPRENLEKAHELLVGAIRTGAEVIAFPEYFLLMTQSVNNSFRHAQSVRGLWVETLQEWAAESDRWIVAGSLPLKVRGNSRKTDNATLVFGPTGEIATRYRKIHLFDADLANGKKVRESRGTRPGSRSVTLKTGFGTWGLSLCYDLRFPELYRALSARGAEILFAPSAFTAETGRAHWDVLTRARAIENLAYVVAPAQWGEALPGRPMHGHTRIVDPWGRVIAERPEGDGIVSAAIDLDRLRETRKRFPALDHRRPFR